MTTLLRVSTAGDVDDGKSTLIGRLLVETGSVPMDTLESIQKISRGFPGGLDYSLVTDGLAAEQEQKITIDVAYRYFSTPKRRYILADSPGHEQYTANMATGASTADVALILVDAAKGLTVQARRHAVISSLLGIHHVVVSINKMDLAGFSKTVFENIQAEFRKFSERLGFKDMRFVPVSALLGDNVVHRSERMPWHSGESVLQILESLSVDGDANRIDARMPVQMVIRPNGEFRGYAGRIASGTLKKGDEIAILPAGLKAKVASIRTPQGPSDRAGFGESVVLTLDRELDISRGDVLAPVNNLPDVGHGFEATIVWFGERELALKSGYLMKHAGRWSKCSVEVVRYRLRLDDLSRSPAATLQRNDVGRAVLRAWNAIVFEPYSKCRDLGKFILVDPETHQTVAAGFILDRRPEIEMTEPKAKTILLTGLSGAGKSTLAKALQESLRRGGTPAAWLDGDTLRAGLNADLGFSLEDRRENLRRMAHVARLFNQSGTQALCSFIAPLASDRATIRDIVGAENYLEVFVDAPIDVCRRRDVKGLYAKADSGVLKDFTGVGAPYEIPALPDMTVQTERLSVEQSAAQILKLFFEGD